ncbi:hypothetical protein [Anoxybacillus flavithermus]|uniref:hypothetical protein n=1 Tax=Anoxybacillus flavithermus TaxID=33934 RepID=UPI00030B2AFF|nr:hypothetical protein [Anoxybacillus flavithermus]
MVLFFMLAMIVHDYEGEAKKIEPSVYTTVTEKLDEPFQPRQYIRKIEKKKERAK